MGNLRARLGRLERQLASTAGRPDDCDFDGSILWSDEPVPPGSLLMLGEDGQW